ncbi:MAG TPA: S8 family serine peptidase [Pyrinomonadaceae bacterium]|jgi:Spy/CpxP family protein refolding chaperone
MRSLLFALLVVTCAVAVSAGTLLPIRSSSASAQQGNGNSAGNNGQGAEQMSDRARQQIEALMQEKASRSRGRNKMDSNLIYGIKMHRGEQIAPGIDRLEVRLPRNEQGEAIVDISAAVDKQLLKKLKQAGAKIINSFPEYNTLRAEVSLDALDAIADFPEVYYVQAAQEAMTSQDDGQPNASEVDPEHLSLTHPFSPDYESNISEQLAAALEEFQTNAYSVGLAGVRKSQADVAHRAALARNTYGFDGTGVKIGVLSDGVRNLAAAQASGDVGQVTVLPGQSGTAAGQCATTSACDEGTAMLELIHDLAPGAQLYFATAFPTSANFANNIRALRAAGCDIIVDDVGYFAETPFQDGQAPGVIAPTNGGVVAQAVNDVTASGALYFSSAGNSGNQNDGTSGVWEGDFVDGGNATGPLAGQGRVHQFPGGLPYDVVTAAGSSQYNLFWSDPLGGSSNDYDLYALNAAGTTLIAASTGNQSGTQDPFEAIGVTAANTRLVIVRFSGVGRYLRLTTNRGRLNVNTPGQTSGHSCALNAFGVAAAPAATAFGAAPNPTGPFPNAFNSANQTELFTSDGPRKMFFQANGTPFTAGNFSSTGGIVRQKPDITAADGASVTGAGGFGITFFGTSAAAPHAAAIASLLKSANLSLTPAQIRNALQSTAIDIETPGVDRDTGYGIVMADAALAYIGALPGAANLTLGTVTASDSGGNGNGFIEPGERGTIAVPLLNSGAGQGLNVTASLSSTTPGVSITPSSTRSYADLAATNGSSVSATPFEFVYQEGSTYASNIDFVLNVSYNGITRPYPFSIPTGRMANISTVLDTTAPVVPAGESYTATTGLQTSRMNFTFPISSCGTTKTNPGAAAGTVTRRYDAYSFTNTSASPICVTVSLTHSANALLYVDAYMPTFVPATVSANFAGDNGGSTTSGAGTTQFFSINVPANQTFTIVVSESNQNGGLNVPYNLRVTGLPGAPVPANQPPVNAVPGAQTVLEDGALVFSAAGSNPISISDSDAGNNTVEITIAVTNGVASLGGNAGLNFTSGDGAGDATMTFTGSLADINNALNGLSYSPSADFNGPASLTITTNDKGRTGTGGAKSDTDAVAISVTAVNDAPGFTAGANQTVPEDAGAQTLANWATSIKAGPADEAGQALSFVVNNNNNALFSAQPAIASNGTLTYTPAANANGSATVTVVLKDNGGTDNGGIDATAPVTFNINVTPVNDAPEVAAAPPVQSLQYSDPITPVMVAATDIDSAGSSLTPTVTWKKSTDASFQSSAALGGLSLTETSTGASDRTWKLSGKALVSPGSYIVRVSIADDGTPSGTKYTDIQIDVTREDAAISYTGTQFLLLATAGSNGNVTLSAQVQEAADGAIGNTLAGKQIQFKIFKSTDLTMTSPIVIPNNGVVTLANTSTPGTVTGSMAASLPADIYTVTITLLDTPTYPNPNYQAEVETAALTISDPGATTGGGWLIDPNNNQYRSNFSFSVKNQKNGNGQGNNLFIYRTKANLAAFGAPAGLHDYNFVVKGNALSSLQLSTTTNPKTAKFTGKANITAVDRLTGIAYSIGGNYQYQVDITDKGEPGSGIINPDTYAIRVFDATSNIIVVGTYTLSSGAFVNTAQVNIMGGNIQVK